MSNNYFYYTAWVEKESNLLREGRTFVRKANAIKEAKQLAKEFNACIIVVKQDCASKSVVFDTEQGHRVY